MPKLTNHTEKKLQAFAKTLPAATYYAKNTVQIEGSQILKDNPEAKTFDGKPIKADETYMTGQQLPVNHFKRLKKAYESGGLASVFAYCKPFLLPEKQVDFQAKLQNLLA